MKKNKVLKLTLTAMFIAMIYLFTRFVQIPAPVGPGFLHFGDALIYLCAGIIGGPWAVVAGALGEGLVDLTVGGAVVYAPATIIVKALIALIVALASKDSNKILTWKTAVATIPAGLITVAGYAVADWIIIGEASIITNLPTNICQAVGSAIVFIILAAALDKTKLKTKIKKKF